MVKAVRIHEAGGPEVLRYEDVSLGEPGPGEAVVAQKAIGLNFVDVYFRIGLYPLPALPWTLGMEGAGTVEAVGEGVSHVSVGDRVAYAGPPPPGSYAESRVMPAAGLVKLPADISFEQAAAMMLQGMTVEYLIRRTYPVTSGETVLVHAAAGGVGLIQCQWLKHLGVTVIGTVGSEEKAELARAHGCHHTINYKTEDFAARVQEITDGQGVPVVYDSIGKDTIDGSITSLARLGMMVSFGNASGPVTNFDLAKLQPKSAYITRPTLFGYNATRPELEASAAALFDVVRSGAVRIEIHQTYPLAETAQAHRDLEGRKTTGSTILVP
jgi:NADPH2:quinone reductase